MTKAIKITSLNIALLFLIIVINFSSAAFINQNISYTFNTYGGGGQSVIDINEDCQCGFPTVKARESVYIGGMPLGFEFKTKGLIIIGKTEVVTESGLIDPNNGSNIEIGDILLKVDGCEINTADELSRLINLEHNRGKKLKAELKRHNVNIVTQIGSAKDSVTDLYKTGLWIRQDTFGVGTLTFIKNDLRYAALGHPVIDADTKDMLLIRGGSLLNCSIAGCVKGERGKPGEIKGLIMKNTRSFGTIDKNCIYGVYGQIESIIPNEIYSEPVEIMPRSKVKPGKAYILTTLNGSTPQKYEIQIVKTNYQAKACDRSMVIKITDSKLLSVTGGIVQGMSGSPIIQDDKLCGAVTHVFVNDPTRGYGLYADWMINQ